MFHRFFRPAAAGICGLLLATAVAAQDGKPNALTAKEAADGWLLLFDGESAFGWESRPYPGEKPGATEVKDGALVLSGGKHNGHTTAALFQDFELRMEVRATAGGTVGVEVVNRPATGGAGYAASGRTLPPSADWVPVVVLAGLSADGTYVYTVDDKLVATKPNPPVRQRYFGRPYVSPPDGQTIAVRNVRLRPVGTKPLFNGRSLAGWKPYKGDAKREKSRFAVTPAGELSVKDGPGDLQTEKAFADFVAQLECKTNGPALNSGLFFRCLPGQYQQGYEAQIQNAVVGGDRTKPLDFGTGAIYRRVPARKVVSDDNEWFTLTVLANGPQVNTWVNGYPVVSWADDRKAAENGRTGLYTKAGPLSIQGHDPMTDLLFRNIRAAELK